MSSFHVGQRVRIPRSTIFPDLAGCCATICGYTDYFGGHYMIDIDGYPLSNGRTYTAPPENLEPIDDHDRQETTTWAQCVWQPKQVQA